MAIVNIIYQANNPEFDDVLLDLKSYVKKYDSILKMTEIDNDKFSSMVDHVFGFDIIIGLSKSDITAVKYFLKEDTLTDARFEEIAVENPNTMAKYSISSTVEDIANILQTVKESIEPILMDKTRDDISRWIRDDIGCWYYRGLSNTVQEIRNAYNDSNPSKYVKAMDKMYKTYIRRIAGRKESKYYLFGEDGYVCSTTGLNIITEHNRAVFIKDDLSLENGWILVDGKWHLFNRYYYSELAALIDDTLYSLKRNGMLDEDSNLFEVDPDDKFKLHHKGV